MVTTLLNGSQRLWELCLLVRSDLRGGENLYLLPLGGIGTGVYTTNTKEAVCYQLKHSRANIAVVDSEIQLQKVLSGNRKEYQCQSVEQSNTALYIFLNRLFDILSYSCCP